MKFVTVVRDPNPRRDLRKIPPGIKPMLATLVSEPFDKPGWVYEEKYDGERILAYKEDGQVRLLSRRAIDRKESFPHIVTAVRNLRAATLVLDGEMVVFDRKGASRFQLLQQGKGDPVYAVFDCLLRNGKDLRRECLSVRRAAMEEAIDCSKHLYHLGGLPKTVLRPSGSQNVAGTKD